MSKQSNIECNESVFSDKLLYSLRWDCVSLINTARRFETEMILSKKSGELLNFPCVLDLLVKEVA